MKKAWNFFWIVFAIAFMAYCLFLVYSLTSHIWEIKDPTNIIIAFIALIWYGLKHYFDQKSEVNKQKREIYLEFINVFMLVFRQSKTGERIFDGKGNLNEDFAKRLYDIMQKMVLYVPSEIYLASNEFWFYIRHSGEKMDVAQMFKKLTRVFILMRKDIGLDTKLLGNDGEKLMLAFISDWDKYF